MKQLLILLLLVWNAAFADDLYSVDVPVSSASNSVRLKALPMALKQVLVKVSGNSALRTTHYDSPNFSSIVEAYRYHRDRQGKQLHVRFQRQAIEQLLGQLGYSVWDENRPLLLVWLAIEDKQGSKQLITQDSEGVLADQVNRLLQARGLPMLFPLVDLNLINTVPIEKIWDLDVSALVPFAQHYAANAQLVIRLKQATVDTWHANATLFLHDEQFDFVADNSDVAAALGSVIDQLGDSLANTQQPVIAAQQHHDVTLTVTHIATVDQYAQLMAYLKTLALVKDQQVVRIKPKEIDIALTIEGDIQQLQQAFRGERYLVATKSSVRATAELADHLIYRWDHESRTHS